MKNATTNKLLGGGPHRNTKKLKMFIYSWITNITVLYRVALAHGPGHPLACTKILHTAEIYMSLQNTLFVDCFPYRYLQHCKPALILL